jgi:hypothetical protein
VGSDKKRMKARRAPRKGTRREGSGQTTPRPREREGGSGTQPEREEGGRWRREGEEALQRGEEEIGGRETK